MNLSIDLHYCQKNLKSFSFFGKAKACHDQENVKHCQTKKRSCHAAISKQQENEQCNKDCCMNKQLEIFSAAKVILKERFLKQFSFIPHFTETFTFVCCFFNKKFIPFLNYISPLLNKNINIFVQSFLC